MPPPTAPPAATATPATTWQAIADIANRILGGSGTTISVSFTPRTGYAVIKDTLADPTFDPAPRAQIIKDNTYVLMVQLFTNRLPITEVYFRVDGPLVDQNGNTSIGIYAEVVLTAATAKTFNWDTLTPNQAWGEYDSAFVRNR
jgi:hypothetical protein